MLYSKNSTCFIETLTIFFCHHRHGHVGTIPNCECHDEAMVRVEGMEVLNENLRDIGRLQGNVSCLRLSDEHTISIDHTILNLRGIPLDVNAG